MSRNRLVIATAVAPLALLVGFVAIDIATGQSLSFSWSLLIGGYIVGFGYMGMIILGLPIFFVLRRANLLNWFSLLAAGAIAGILVIFIAGDTLGRLLGSSAPFDLISIAWGALSGLIVAFSFSAIAGIKFRKNNHEAA